MMSFSVRAALEIFVYLDICFSGVIASLAKEVMLLVALVCLFVCL